MGEGHRKVKGEGVPDPEEKERNVKGATGGV